MDVVFVINKLNYTFIIPHPLRVFFLFIEVYTLTVSPMCRSRYFPFSTLVSFQPFYSSFHVAGDVYFN